MPAAGWLCAPFAVTTDRGIWAGASPGVKKVGWTLRRDSKQGLEVEHPLRTGTPRQGVMLPEAESFLVPVHPLESENWPPFLTDPVPNEKNYQICINPRNTFLQSEVVKSSPWRRPCVYGERGHVLARWRWRGACSAIYCHQYKGVDGRYHNTLNTPFLHHYYSRSKCVF